MIEDGFVISKAVSDEKENNESKWLVKSKHKSKRADYIASRSTRLKRSKS